MNTGIFVALLGEILLGVSLVIDKFLVEDKPERALPYVFWIGILNIFAILFIPFGFSLPPITAIFLSLGAALAFLLTQGCMYGALTRGGVTSTMPIIGGFSPIATYLLGSLVFLAPFNIAEKIAFVLLVMGGFILFFSEGFNLKKIIPWVLGAAFFTGATNVLEKLAFGSGNFVSIFVTMKLLTFLLAASLLTLPRLRKRIFRASRSDPHNNRYLYLGNRLASGIGSFLIFYAISLNAHPALIESLSGLRYVIIFIAVFILIKFWPRLIKERPRGWSLAAKIIATIIIAVALAGLSAQTYYEQKPVPDPRDVSWGVTFSAPMARHFGTDANENLTAIINGLKPARIRLIAYWDEIEATSSQFDFSELDSQMDLATKANMPIILAVGEKAPRWPECHFPSWLAQDNYNLRRGHLLTYIQKTVERYKNRPNLLYWQVENEPFLIFGTCPQVDAKLIDDELSLVRKLDPSHKIYMTDGGEFGDWYRAAKKADIVGPTLYRKVHTRLFGYISWPITPQLYSLHKDVVRFLTGKPDQEFVISELGLEPWMVKQIYEVPTSTQFSFFNMDDFKNNISYARQTGFKTFDTWGVEWWYWLKTTQNDPSFWNAARDLFAGGKH